MKGRATQTTVHNRFERNEYVELPELDCFDPDEKVAPKTQVFISKAKSLLNKVESPDISMPWSINPYQGCEHGCAYCYARPSHEYWGFNAGLDFEQKIVAKINAPQLLAEKLSHKDWLSAPIALSGNTDCYQPIEQHYQLTRKLLETFLYFGNPVGIITKNALLLRDLDLLTALHKEGLVHVHISITTLNEHLRRMLEPRTSSIAKRLEAVRKLSDVGIPVGVMAAPIIPGLNDHELPALLKAAADAGARTAGYTVVRLNGQVSTVFKAWVKKFLPHKANKILHQVAAMHGGELSDSQFGRRMSGEGKEAEMIQQLFRKFKGKYFEGKEWPSYRLDRHRPSGTGMLF